MSIAYIFAKLHVDQYITEFHPAGRKARRPWAFGAKDLPQDDHFGWKGWQVFKTPEEALVSLKEHVNYFKTNYPTHTDLDEESDFAIYEIEVDWDEDVYIDSYWYHEHDIAHYHLWNSCLMLRKHPHVG